MKNNQSITHIDDSFTEKWFLQEFSLVTGLYHLTYDGQWHCIFASDNCFKILKCTCSDFLESLQNLVALTAYKASPKTVGTMMHEITAGQEPCSFISVRPWENGRLQYIKGTLAVCHSQEGLLCVHGQITDVSGEQAKDVYSKDIEEMYRSSLHMSGRSIYRYQIKGRRGIIPSEMTKRGGVPEIVDNLPEWDVKCGHIAPQSVDAWLEIFDAIDRGEKQGAADVVFRIGDGEVLRRCRVEFIGITDEAGIPVSAIVSHRDITDEYERDYQQSLDRAGLLQIAQMAFPEIFSMNLTRGTYRMIQYYAAATLNTPKDGPLDQILLPLLDNVAPEDQEAFKKNFFPEGQLKAIREGKEQIHLTYRRRGADGIWHWMESTIVHQENPYGDDILTFAVSHSIDEEKAKEIHLREQLRQQSEELKLTMSQMGKHISYYDVPASTLTTLPSTAKEFGVPLVMENFPESFLASPPEGYPPETGEILRSFINAIRRGDPTGSCRYLTVNADGRKIWLHREFATIFDDCHQPVRAVISSEDVTESYIQTEENRQLKALAQKNQQIFQIVSQHSNRTLYAYDLQTGTTRPWDAENQKKDILAHMYEGSYSHSALDLNQSIMPDCADDVKRFFTDIHSGKPTGEVNVHVKLVDGQLRWYHFRYSSLFDGSQPTVALISIEDVTEHHEQELAYRRYVQKLGLGADGRLMYIESDLTADRIEKLSGLLLPLKDRNIQCSHSDFGRVMLDPKFRFKKTDEASDYFSCKNLLTLYENGERNLKSKWQVHFQDGTTHWLDTETTLIADPYNGHIKAFLQMMDITDEYEEYQSALQRADYDAMTGLLRRDVGEALIQKHLSAQTESGGILIALDLDDLKNINDTLGHTHGDKAIIGIADILKSHFSKDDVLVRVGGDEFMVFLPGAGKNISSVELSLADLLRKLSGISIGDNDERTIHCSIGCAVELPDTDTFASLYQRADMALYHVKRSNKNNFAFFEPAMLEDDYQFKISQARPVMNDAVKTQELQHLLEAVSAYFPGIVLFNLTQNYFHVLSVGSHIKEIPLPDKVDAFWQNWRENIHPDDQASTLSAMSRSGLLSLYSKGQRSTRHYYRNLEPEGYVKTKIVVQFYTTEFGDICAFLFFRWDTAPEKDLEIQRLHKILELSRKQDFEYICLIHVHEKSYSTFSRDCQNSHAIPENADFETVTKHIRDTQIPPEDRHIYYEKAALNHVLQHMNGPEGQYSYRYTMMDGSMREAVFNWYEDRHFELLMTVRKCSEA